MSHVFLSYSKHDRHDAIRIARELGKRGQKVWVDVSGIKVGGTYREAIDKAIRGSRAVLVLVTPRSSSSQYVTYEWSYALGCSVPVLPVLLRQTKTLHPRLEALQHVDATKQLRLAPVLQQLRGDVGKASGTQVRSRTKPPVISATFQMLGNRFKRNGREYGMVVGTKNVPAGTERVRYEIVEDETVKDPVWTVSWKRDFEDEVSLYGDVYIAATGRGDNGAWRAQARLSDALVNGYGQRHISKSPPLQKAIRYIANH